MVLNTPPFSFIIWSVPQHRAIAAELAKGRASGNCLPDELSTLETARCTGCHATNITPLLASFTGQDDAQQEPVGKLQSSLRIPELRHYECTTIWHQGLAGDDTRRVGKVCQLTLRCPGGRLPDWSVEGAGEEWKKTKQNKKNTQRGNRGGRRCILHWIKLQTFLEALAYISGEYERGRDITVCANMK